MCTGKARLHAKLPGRCLMAGAVIAMLALCLAPCLAFALDGGSGPSSNLLKAGIIVASDLDAQDEPCRYC